MTGVNWDHHFEYYDLFQNNYPRYISTLQFHVDELDGYMNVLDTGSGSGNLTLELLKKGHRVTAVDFNQYALNILSEKCSAYSSELEIVNSDVSKMHLEGPFDAATSVFVIPFVENLPDYFANVYAPLRPEGKFVISAWAPIPGLVDLALKEVQEIESLKSHTQELYHLLESSRQANNVVVNGPGRTRVTQLLREAGFRDVTIHQNNPYGEYSYFISCKK